MHLTIADLLKHLYLIGGTGVGKSRLLEWLVLSVIRLGCGVAVVDPHGELYHNLVARLSLLGKGVWERVILVNPVEQDFVVGINPLELQPGEVAERRAMFLAGVINKLFAVDDLVAARMQRVMLFAFWLLIVHRLTLAEFASVLTDPEFRNSLLMQLPPSHKLRRYWTLEFPQSERLASDWVQSSLNKVDELVTDPAIALMLGQARSTINWSQLLDEKRILLVNLSKGSLVAKNSYLLGGFIVGQIQLAALARSQRVYTSYSPFILFCDEFHNFVTEDTTELLAESRKYGLGAVLSHQFFGQLHSHPALQQAVLNTVNNLAVFRIGASDADLLVRDILTPEIDRVKHTRKRIMPTGLNWWPFFYEDEAVYRPLDETWTQEARRLTSLSVREFWFKQRGMQGAMKLRTVDMPDIKRTIQLEQAIAELTAQVMTRCGRSKAEVTAEIAERWERLGMTGEGVADDDIPPAR